jgi:hypothetical protein
MTHQPRGARTFACSVHTRVNALVSRLVTVAPVAGRAVRCPAAMWGRLVTCGRLAIGLLTSLKIFKRTIVAGGVSATCSRPITNRPQVNNLPHKELNLACGRLYQEIQ